MILFNIHYGSHIYHYIYHLKLFKLNPLPTRAYRNLRTSRIVEGILSFSFQPTITGSTRSHKAPAYFHKGLKGVVLWFSGIQRNDLT